VEIIPSLTSIQVKREVRERRRLSDELSEDTDHLPKMKVFTASDTDEETIKKRKSKKMVLAVEGRPKRWRQVRLTMKSGEVISGRVSHVEKIDKGWFYVDDGEKMYIPKDLNEVDEWIYDQDE